MGEDRPWDNIRTAIIGLFIGRWQLANLTKLWIGSVSLALEVAALVVLAITTYREQLPGVVAPRTEYAKQLDFDTVGHFDLLDWLIAFGADVLNASRDFTKLRRARMEQRLPLLVGASQSFGLLPLAGVIYLQAHEFSRAGQLGWLEGFSLLLLVMLYYAGFTASGVKQRLDLMDMYLEEAVRLRNLYDAGKEIFAVEFSLDLAAGKATEAGSGLDQ